MIHLKEHFLILISYFNSLIQVFIPKYKDWSILKSECIWLLFDYSLTTQKIQIYNWDNHLKIKGR